MENTIRISALGAATMLFVAPFNDFTEVRRSKRVGERSVLPFVCMWCCCALWVVYGLFVWDIVPTVATNVVGLVFSMYYCGVFVWAVEPASRKNSTYNLFAATFLLVCLVVTFCLGDFLPRVEEDLLLQDGTSGDEENERAQRYLGLAASASTAVQYAAPLAELVKVMKRRSTEGMSLTLALVSLVCSGLWLAYGITVVNAFIYIPNVLGLCFSAVQCALFWAFPSTAKSTVTIHGDLHKGSV